MQGSSAPNPQPALHGVIIDDPISVDYPHRKQLKFADFDRIMLNRELRITRAFGDHAVEFKLGELLKHLGVQSAYLKGSTANQWNKSNHSGDIDLQFFPPPGTDLHKPNVMATQLRDFLERKAAEGSPSFQLHETRHWMKTIDEKSGGAWQRTLICLGYPGRTGFSNIDLHCSNRTDGVNHDTLSASTVMYFNTAKKQLAKLNVWSESLMDFFEQHRLTWFNPSIENGLGRLSYRASKNPPLTLVQPKLFEHFVERASSGELAQVYCRLLTQTPDQLKLNQNAVAELWTHVIQDLQTQADAGLTQATQTLEHVLGWSRRPSAAALQMALRDSSQQAPLVQTLCQGFRVVLEHRRVLLEFLKQCNACRPGLLQHGQQALRVFDANPQDLLDKIYSSKAIHNAPEVEMLAVFEAFLGSSSDSSAEPLAGRAKAMLSYLKGETAGKLDFAIQQIPKNARSCPSKEMQERVLDTLEEFLDQHSLLEAAPRLNMISQLGLRAEHVHQLPRILLKNFEKRGPSLDPSRFKTVFMMAMYIAKQHEPTVQFLMQASQIPMGAWTPGIKNQALYLMGALDQLHGMVIERGIPPALKQVLEKKGERLILTHPSGKWTYNTIDRELHVQADRTHWCLNHQLKMVCTQQLFQETMQVLRVYWPDNTYFQGTACSRSKLIEGQLCNIDLETGHEILKPFQTQLDVIKLHWSKAIDPNHQLRLQGVFDRAALESAEALKDASLAFQTGSLRQSFANAHVSLEYTFKHGKPVRCHAHAHHILERPGLMFNFVEKPETSIAEVGQHPWRSSPWDQVVRMRYVACNRPYQNTELEVNVPWDDKNQTMCGFGTVIGYGAQTFQWQGLIEENMPSPVGALYLPKPAGDAFEDKPAICFDAEALSDPIPIAFMPLLAEFIGPKLHGKYPFAGNMWNGQAPWPTPGRECFARVSNTNCNFSGYLFSNDKALGCLKVDRSTTSATAIQTARVMGNFILVPDKFLNTPLHMATPERGVLVPHGLCDLNTEMAEDHANRQSVFFSGEEFAFKQITLQRTWRYSSPLESHYFMGLRYKKNASATPENIHLIFNPDDHGPDYMVSMPSDLNEHKADYYRFIDTQGFQMNQTLKNKRLQIASMIFPNGLRYTGELVVQNGLYKPSGRGGYSWKDCQITLQSDGQGKLINIDKANLPASALLQGVKLDGQGKTVAQLLEILFAGELDWDKDCAPHLRVRYFDHLKSKAVVFNQ